MKTGCKFFPGLNPVDLITLLYLLITGAWILAAYSSIDTPGPRLLFRLATVTFILALVLSDRYYGNRFIRFLHNFYPLALLGYLYGETDAMNNVLSGYHDPVLVKAEEWIFGFQPSLEFSHALPQAWFSEIMYLGYFSYFMVIFFFMLYLYLRQHNRFEESVFIVVLSFFLYYLIFILFPSQGPQYYHPAPIGEVPEGFFFCKAVRIIQQLGERPTGAFPSAHVGIILIVTIVSRNTIPATSRIIIPVAGLMMFSTIYIKAHYLIDVIAGIVTCPVFYFLTKISYAYLLQSGVCKWERG